MIINFNCFPSFKVVFDKVLLQVLCKFRRKSTHCLVAFIIKILKENLLFYFLSPQSFLEITNSTHNNDNTTQFMLFLLFFFVDGKKYLFRSLSFAEASPERKKTLRHLTRPIRPEKLRSYNANDLVF